MSRRIGGMEGGAGSGIAATRKAEVAESLAYARTYHAFMDRLETAITAADASMVMRTDRAPAGWMPNGC